jgi:phosphoenolpyruvate synthase/pyruvate phosphate dikinase
LYKSKELTGTAASPGAVTGKVLILSDPTEAAHIPHDTILVTSTTDPSWTPLFMHVAGTNKVVFSGNQL